MSASLTHQGAGPVAPDQVQALFAQTTLSGGNRE
jgi:hypothetical protein